MAATDVGTAFINVVAKTDQLAPGIAKAAEGAGKTAGKGLSSGIGDGLSGLGGMAAKVGSVFGGVAATAAKAVGVVGAAVSSAMGAIGAGAVSATSSYEQLAGGARKIFDEMDYSAILADAQNAYTELNMSANEYLQSINTVGATFAQTMGDQAGYDTARKGMIAIADFASGTGANLSELNEKYKMITRSTSSYQTICDQFAGILPQTNDAFMEQAKAAGYLSEGYEKITDVPIDEYQAAVTAMLADGVEQLNLTGNTAAEAASSMEGSLLAMRGAWKNWLASLGTDEIDTADMTSRLVSAAGAVATNFMPVVAQVVSSMATALPQIMGELGPAVGDALADVGKEVDLSALIDTALDGVVEVGSAIVGYLPTVAGAIVGAIPVLAEKVAAKLDESLTGGVAGSLLSFGEDIAGRLGEAFGTFATGIDLGALWELASTIGSVLGGAVDVAAAAFSAAAPVLADVANAVMPVLGAGIAYVADTLNGLWSYTMAFGSSLLEHMQPGLEAVSPLVSALGDVLGTVGSVITGHVLPVLVALADIAGGMIGDAFTVAAFVVQALVDKFSAVMERLAPVGEFFSGIADGISGAWGRLEETLGVGADSVEQSTTQVADAASAQAEQAGTSWDAMRAQYDTAISGMGDAVGAEMASASESLGDEAASGGELAAQAFEDATAAAKDAFGGFGTDASQELNKVVSDTQSAMNQVRAAIPSTLSFPSFTRPYIALPHFSISGQFDAKSGTVPSVGVSWYGKGGIVDDATLIGAGERGAELLWPSYGPYLDKYASAIADRMDGQRGGDTYVIEKVEYLPDTEMARYARGLFVEARRLGRM